MGKLHVIRITDALGSKAIQKALGVTHHAVRYARTDGLFPASWYGPLSGMCAEAQVECPLEAFNWRSPVAPSDAGVSDDAR